ncbi:hypothetical protein CQW23_32686 [Capsicum baccatum]|uniref:Protein TAR1 n=1 Tax=Capsicum baccatum TaxID=33114 RepID=A0A2G2V432_CAPBA|nr:hypothetical protein CQW23_32686 [Capsicum baccatum]
MHKPPLETGGKMDVLDGEGRTGATWCHGALVPWCHAALVPRCHGATVPWCLAVMVPWCLGALVPWCHAALVPWFHAALVLRWHGATVPWCHGALVTWRHGAKLPWCLGAMVHEFMANATFICKERRTGQIGVDEGPIPNASTPSEYPYRCSRTTTSHDEAREAWDARVAYRFAPRTKSHASLEKQEANSGEVSLQHLVGFFKDGCTNLLWRRAARWLDWMGRDDPERQRAESQWIVAARPLCHLQYPVAYLSHIQRILPAARWKLYFNCTLRRPPRPFRRGSLAYDMCPWGSRPLLRVGKQTTGTCVACSPDSNLEAFSHNPAHAHVPYWWVNNPTLGEFCFTMIGRADIEGSKSNVAMNAWLPQASYPCGNFSDTSSFEFRRSKGSLGHAFTMCRPSQTPHLTMSSARIGPQSEPWVQKEGQCPASDSRNNRIPLVRTSSELVVQRAVSISSSPPTANVLGTGTPVPSPQSQSFSRSYGSILPTSLSYIVPSTRGCSPWRPDAVMSTIGRGRNSVLRIFKGRRERTGHHATCGALLAAGPYLQLSRFLGGQAVCSHSKPSQKIKVGRRCPPRADPTNQLHCALRVYLPVDSHTCQTPWSVFEDGSNGEPTGQRPERTDAEARQRRALPAIIEETTFHEPIESLGFGRPLIHAGPRPESIGGQAHRRSTSFSRHIAGPHPLPSRQFQAFFDSLFKVLFIFPSRYLFAIGLSLVFSLGRNSLPDLGCIPKQPDS